MFCGQHMKQPTRQITLFGSYIDQGRTWSVLGLNFPLLCTSGMNEQTVTDKQVMHTCPWIPVEASPHRVMTEPGGRRVAIGIDESNFAEQAFDCKFELYFFDLLHFMFCTF